MPNRILREGILTSERVNLLSWEAEVFYRRLMSVVDDFGRYHAHPSLLRAALYPLKLDTVREVNMERLLAAVEQARLVRLYEVDGKRYLELQDFKQQVRAKESKFPQPQEHAAPARSTCVADAAHVPIIRAAYAPVFGDEDGCEGEDEKHTFALSSEMVGFAKFWTAWPKHPRKVARKQCEAKWRTEGCEAITPQILASLERWKAHEQWTKRGGEFIPAPLVWLNQHRWDVDLSTTQGASRHAGFDLLDYSAGVNADGSLA